MAPKLIFVFVIQVLIYKVYSSQVQPTLKHYLITAPQPQLSTIQSVVPSSSKPTTSLSALASLASLLSSGASTNLQTLPSLVTAAPTSHVAPPVASPPVATPPEKPLSNGVDMELLNNLAIALQLMIVNNILSTPPTENQTANPETKSNIPSFESIENLSYAPIQNDLPIIANQYQSYQPSAYEPQQISYMASMPNSHFVGSAGFADVNPFMSSVPPPSPSRSGLTLMSPYEALSPSSPYMDPILSSPYGSVISSKKDFQSPYAAILGSDKDYFSMSSINDLF